MPTPLSTPAYAAVLLAAATLLTPATVQAQSQPQAQSLPPAAARPGAAPALVRADPNSPANAGRRALSESLNDLAAKDTAVRRDTVATIKTRAEAQARQAKVRAKILSLIGPLPEKTPLNAQVLGATQADGFRIEKVLYDSQPGFHVTALFYIPDSNSRIPDGKAAIKLPAIIMAPGHGATGKAGDYAQAATFARNGFAVLSYDPIGQGERLQYPDPARPGESLATRPTGEHGEAGLQPVLIGEAVAKYFVWDGIRGIDYLMSRPEVDPARIGAMGCSGGGTITALTAALDGRVAATGVACYTTSFDELLSLKSVGPQDGEQSIPGFIAPGPQNLPLDFPDWIELVAPRPYAVLATYNDMFPFAGARSTVIEARRFYSLFDPASAGTGDGGIPPTPAEPTLNPDTTDTIPPTAALQFITGPGGHGNLGPIMDKIVSFFMINLQPGVDATHPTVPPVRARTPGAAPAAPPSNGLPKDALQVTATGQVATSYPDSETVFSLNLKHAAKVIPARRPVLTGAALSAAVRKVTAADAIPGTSRGLVSNTTGPSNATYHVEHLAIGSEPGIDLNAELAVPRAVPAIGNPANVARHPAILLLIPDSMDGTSPAAKAIKQQFQTLADAGNIVLAVNPRPSPPGTEETKSPVLGDMYLTTLRALLVGKTILGLRVDDTIRATDYLATRKDVDPANITAIASGHMGLVLLHAAVLDSRLKHVTIDHALASYDSLLKAPLPLNAPVDVVPGVLLHYDIPDLTHALGARVTFTDPLQGTEDLSYASSKK
jgi:cephalosporin-C deacetylase-like acetyl esterase